MTEHRTGPNAMARIEYDERPTIIQRWVAVMTSPSGFTRRKRHLSREAAIDTAAGYLSIHDERLVQARLAHDSLRRNIGEEYVEQLDKLTPAP